jgi:hypothetical protein
METAQGRQRYEERISRLLTNVFQVGPVTNRVWQLAAKVRPFLAESGPRAVRDHESAVSDLCDRIEARAQSIRQQLASPNTAVKFNTAGRARFTEWFSRTEHGKPVLDEGTEAGRKVLHIAAPAGSAVGVWFTEVQLEPGRYRFEGRVRSQGVVPDAGDRRGGAGLRISERRFTQKLTNDNGWTDLVFDFEIQGAPTQFGFAGQIEEALTSVELLCELRAAKGQAWFDRDSLRLVRR